MNFIVDNTSRNLIKHWTKGVDLDDRALEQLRSTANLPFIHKHLAAMPDTHWGMGATIGSVIATKGAIVPAAVGVDIGCGMMAIQTTLTANDLPDNLHAIRTDIEQAVPYGRSDNGGRNDRGAWSYIPEGHNNRWLALEGRYNEIIAKHPKAKAFNTYEHMGTLGTGNHFIEVCLDENDTVWVMLHSGSRGVGNRIGSYFIEQAKREMERYFIGQYLPDKDLSYLVEHTEIFEDYVTAVAWAQDYALQNREGIMENVMFVMHKHFGDFETTE
ncbi:RtcB family protein, partial [bacterium]|nr:RtcB family protein [bacterium]